MSNGFHLRDELASRMFVKLYDPTRNDPGAVRTLTKETLAAAQEFCEEICSERGHNFELHHWVEGDRPTAQGRASGAPLGVYECSRCARQEERRQQR